MKTLKLRYWSASKKRYITEDNMPLISTEESDILTLKPYDNDAWELFTGLTLNDENQTPIYMGDVLKVSYTEDGNTKLFDMMKERGEKFIYIILDVQTPILGIAYRTSDEVNYFTGSNPNSDGVHFLRYLIFKGLIEVVGTIHDEELMKEIDELTTKAEEEAKGQKI